MVSSEKLRLGNGACRQTGCLLPAHCWGCSCDWPGMSVTLPSPWGRCRFGVMLAPNGTVCRDGLWPKVYQRGWVPQEDTGAGCVALARRLRAACSPDVALGVCVQRSTVSKQVGSIHVSWFHRSLYRGEGGGERGCLPSFVLEKLPKDPCPWTTH